MYKTSYGAGHNMQADLCKCEYLMLDFSKCFLFTSIETCVSLNVMQLRKRDIWGSAENKSEVNEKYLVGFLQRLRAKLHPSLLLPRAGRRHSFAPATSQEPLLSRTTLNFTNIKHRKNLTWQGES